jgi:hypothetical protein
MGRRESEREGIAREWRRGRRGKMCATRGE